MKSLFQRIKPEHRLWAVLLAHGVLAFAGIAGASALARWMSALSGAGVAMKAGAALLPLPFYAYLFWVIHQAQRREDELGQRITMETYAVTLAALLLFSIAYGRLESAAIGVPCMNLVFLAPIMAPLIVLSYSIASRRYS